MANVHLHPQAVLDKPGTLRLFLHLNYARNPERFSQGSSLIAQKRNVDETHGVEVEEIDLCAFIEGLGRRVALLKIDIEGAEYAVLHAMLDRGTVDLVDKIFVETHAHAIPTLAQSDARLRQRIAEMGLSQKIDLNWI